MLKLVEPYVTYGYVINWVIMSFFSYPNVKSVKDLLYKRGALKVSKQRIPLTDNAIVEQNLGKLGMLCVEDVINEIFTVGKNFKEVNNAIWPFQLKSPAGGFIRKRNHYVEGGDFGNRETKVCVLWWWWWWCVDKRADSTYVLNSLYDSLAAEI